MPRIPHSRPRPAFTLVELLVVIAIIGVLVALLLPAAQQAREAARRMHCQNNLKQIGLATLNFHDTNRAFPPARFEPLLNARPPFDCGGNEPSWLVRILPYLEQTKVYSQWDVNAPYRAQRQDVIYTWEKTYVCPSRRLPSTALVEPHVIQQNITLPCGCGAVRRIRLEGGVTGDYAGNHGDPSPGAVGGPNDYYLGGNGTGVIISSQAKCVGPRPVDWIDKIRISSIKDGTSNTFLAGELHVKPGDLNEQPYNGPIYNGQDLSAFARIGGPGVPLARFRRDDYGPILGFGSWHPNACNFALSDGSVRALTVHVDTTTLGRLCHRADGETNVDY